jgi:hypothetical protein
MNSARELAILTTAHTQQVAVLSVTPSLGGVPRCTYQDRFYPHSLAISPKLMAVLVVLVSLVISWL